MTRATVKAVTPSLTVTLDSGDAEIPAQRLATYTPVVNDRVAGEQLGGQFLILGKVI